MMNSWVSVDIQVLKYSSIQIFKMLLWTSLYSSALGLSYSSITILKYSNFQVLSCWFAVRLAEHQGFCLEHPCNQVHKYSGIQVLRYKRFQVFKYSNTQLLLCSTLGWASRILQQHQRCPWRAFRRRPVFHLPVLARLGKARHIANSYVPFSQVIQIFLCGDSIVD